MEYYSPVETHLIPSRHVAQTFKIQVMLPARKRVELRRFPVVYVTDGNWAFDMLKGISLILQTHERDAPRFILVGIGYPGDSPRAGALLRARDLTFPGFPQFAPRAPPIEAVEAAVEGTRQTHGGEDFRLFIEHELIPFIDRTYPATSGERTYFGHSGGGGFGLFTLFTRPHLFNRYIVSSANLAFHGESSAGLHYDNYDFLMRGAREFIASAGSLDGIHLYLSVGAEEEFEPGSERWQLTSSFYRMAQEMRRACALGLELTTEAFAGETHMTVWPMAFVHGIQVVFGTRAWGERAPTASVR